MFKKAGFVLLLLGLLACNEQIENSSFFKDTLPDSNGGRLDLIVVAKEPLWQSIAGDYLRKLLTSQQPLLPQPEPLYTVRQIEPSQFNDLLKRSRNIIILDEGNGSFITEKNKWAKPQLVTTISAPDPTELAQKIKQKGEEMEEALHQSEVEVLQKRLFKETLSLPKALKARNVSLRIPSSFQLEVEEEGLFIFWNKTLKTDQGLIIHFQPLDPDQAIVGSNIISLRDSITQKYILGQREGSYMVTEDLLTPQIKNMELDKQFAAETRGLWRTEGEFKGGPFISYTVYDEINQQIVTLDAFLFAPEIKKRNILFELEAILKSFEITN